MVCTVALVYAPALKSEAVCEVIVRLSRLKITVSRRLSGSCMIFFRHRNVVDLRFYWIPDIHETLVKWPYVKIQNPSVPTRCYVPSLGLRLKHHV
ncbi:hypothetical protein TNCV_231841 [Trichonephila clavipes]|nr:hypothetical protein TNCV_231841 [Trichonephila clavipes]